ncbi:hypothetical protein SMCF_1527 [Streptomyces coelicoflavus ZG0656]|nr:hypothetical protein SMCF_1527 [Streptomyces coelicoflavus ZG0656]MZE47105.1 hypothetical protein [Streptomyces sp. SID5477]
MNRSGLMLLVQVDGAVEGTTVIVVFEGQASAAAVPVSGQRRSWRLSAVLAAGMLVRALCGSAALALMHGAQQVRWAEVSDWLTF